jgi:hypothetical protein
MSNIGERVEVLKEVKVKKGKIKKKHLCFGTIQNFYTVGFCDDELIYEIVSDDGKSIEADESLIKPLKKVA